MSTYLTIHPFLDYSYFLSIFLFIIFQDYHEGLLHEEELAIRRALQASLHETKAKNDEPHTTITLPHRPHLSRPKAETNKLNNNHFDSNKLSKSKRKKHHNVHDNQQSNGRKCMTSPSKKLKLNLKGSAVSSRSRSSSLNSLDSVNSSDSTSKNSTRTVSSASSQTKSNFSKLHDTKAAVKMMKKKDKLGVKVRRKLMKKKLKSARNGSDEDSTMSGSTYGVVSKLKTRRSRRRLEYCYFHR